MSGGTTVRNLVWGLIIILLAVNLLPSVNSGVAIITTPTYSSSVASFTSLYTLFFALMGFFAFFKLFDI